MISRDLLFAILQGLPPEYLEHLPRPWPSFARHIAAARKQRAAPVVALRYAIYRLGKEGRALLRSALAEIPLVADIPDLSYRQKEALIALRTVKTASISKLSSMLAQDRSNTYRRMQVLLDKGYAIKFFQPNGVHYMAIGHQILKSERYNIQKFIEGLIENFPEETDAGLEEFARVALPLLPWADLVVKPPTTTTTPTTLTTPTTSTTALVVKPQGSPKTKARPPSPFKGL